MRVTVLAVRNFRNHEAAELRLGDGLTVVSGPNGAGKTNLLEALYFALTARSCRTTSEREVIRFGEDVTRLEACVEDALGDTRRLAVGYGPLELGGALHKRISVDGASVERLVAGETRPLVSVFLPDRLELVTGAPALRRGHLDQVVAALWPARVVVRQAYGRTLAQRNALLAGIRAGRAGRESLRAWDAQLAEHGLALMAIRAELIERLRPRFAALGELLGLALAGELDLVYRPRSRATERAELVAELAERVDSDVERGFTGHGPHRDDLALACGGRTLRSYGSRGQQRLALLALLLAEREELAESRGTVPLLLLDDVLSELDDRRRRALIELLRGRGQALLTTTERERVDWRDAGAVAFVDVGPDGVRQEEAGAA